MNSERIFKGQTHYVTSPYGMRTHPITRKSKMHWGTDYGTHGKKIPCYCVEDGYVRVNTFHKSMGYYVSIGHKINGKEYRSVYQHLDKKSHLKVGQTIKKGETIGIVGTTGDSTGVHLHLGLFDVSQNKYIDFEKFVFENEDTMTYTVKKGDTLGKIAIAFNTTIEELARLNNIANVNLINVGQVLKIKEKVKEKNELTQKMRQLEKENEELKRQVEYLQEEIKRYTPMTYYIKK